MRQWAGTEAWPGRMTPGHLSRSPAALVQVLLFGLAYFSAAQLRDWFSLGPQHIATLWLPAGLFVGVLLRVAPRR